MSSVLGNSPQTGIVRAITAMGFSKERNFFSNTGKRLMAKCRLLYQENEELGKVISSGRIAKLEGELALQKSFSDEIKKSQSGNYIIKHC